MRRWTASTSRNPRHRPGLLDVFALRPGGVHDPAPRRPASGRAEWKVPTSRQRRDRDRRPGSVRGDQRLEKWKAERADWAAIRLGRSQARGVVHIPIERGDGRGRGRGGTAGRPRPTPPEHHRCRTRAAGRLLGPRGGRLPTGPPSTGATGSCFPTWLRAAAGAPGGHRHHRARGRARPRRADLRRRHRHEVSFDDLLRQGQAGLVVRSATTAARCSASSCRDGLAEGAHALAAGAGPRLLLGCSVSIDPDEDASRQRSAGAAPRHDRVRSATRLTPRTGPSCSTAWARSRGGASRSPGRWAFATSTTSSRSCSPTRRWPSCSPPKGRSRVTSTASTSSRATSSCRGRGERRAGRQLPSIKCAAVLLPVRPGEQDVPPLCVDLRPDRRGDFLLALMGLSRSVAERVGHERKERRSGGW